MNTQETAFLAQIALGWFTVDEQGRIWRKMEFHGGGIATFRRLATPRRAETSSSRKDDGYLRVMFLAGEQRLKVNANRIVWMLANQRDIPAGMEINHINGIKTDNRPENLEPVTKQENRVHAVSVLGKAPKARLGNDNAAAKITPAQVTEIRTLYAARAMSQRELGERFGLTQSAVSAIVLRQSWSHIP